jgi:hypothetical protein
MPCAVAPGGSVCTLHDDGVTAHGRDFPDFVEDVPGGTGGNVTFFFSGLPVVFQFLYILLL